MEFRTNTLFWANVVMCYMGFVAFLSILTRCVGGPLPFSQLCAQTFYLIVGGYMWNKIMHWGERFYFKRVAQYVQRIRAK